MVPVLFDTMLVRKFKIIHSLASKYRDINVSNKANHLTITVTHLSKLFLKNANNSMVRLIEGLEHVGIIDFRTSRDFILLSLFEWYPISILLLAFIGTRPY